MPSEVEAQLKKAIDKILASTSREKLIVAGPGTGKTYLFRKLLESSDGDARSRLVLTFINNLKTDLERSLSDLAGVFTLHGYSHLLLRRKSLLRAGLTRDFRCLPGLASLMKKDWLFLHGEPVPRFIERMRNLEIGDDIDFYFSRANYYDAVDFDDSVFRVLRSLKNEPELVDYYDLVLIDEYQDF